MRSMSFHLLSSICIKYKPSMIEKASLDSSTTPARSAKDQMMGQVDFVRGRVASTRSFKARLKNSEIVIHVCRRYSQYFLFTILLNRQSGRQVHFFKQKVFNYLPERFFKRNMFSDFGRIVRVLVPRSGLCRRSNSKDSS